METKVLQGTTVRTERSLRMTAELLLAVQLLGWTAVGSYELTHIPNDGIAEIAVSAVVLVGLAAAGWWYPPIAGFLLIVPGAVPIGLASASFLLWGSVGGQPTSLLTNLDVGHSVQIALAFGFFVAVPGVAGLLFINAGIKRRRT